MLICDAGDDAYASRVIEVDRATGGVDWQYGVTGPPGTGDGYLHEANFASRLPDGDTLIADTAAHRVLRVTRRQGCIGARHGTCTTGDPPGYGPGMSAPRPPRITSDGRLVVADTIFQQIVTLGYEQLGAGDLTAARLRTPRRGQGVREPHLERRHR